MKQLIYYPPGTYGTFVNWLCSAKGTITTEDLPFDQFGNSHKYYLSGPHTGFSSEFQRNIFLKSTRNFGVLKCCWPTNVGIKLINIDQSKDFYYHTCKDDLQNLMKDCDLILVLHPTEQTRVWWYQNFCEKVMISQRIVDYYRLQNEKMPWLTMTEPLQRARHHLDLQKDQPGLLELFAAYNKASALDFTIWQLRSAMACDLSNQTNEAYQCWEKISQEFKTIKFVKLEDLRDQFQQTAQDILNFFNINNGIVDSLPFVEDQWKQRQEHQFKDALVNSIVDAVANNQDLDWTGQINFFDEVYIQKLLNDRGITMADLDTWPTTTQQFWKIIK